MSVTPKSGCVASYTNYVEAGLARANSQENFFGIDMNLALHRNPMKYTSEHFFKAAGQHIISPFYSAIAVVKHVVKLIFDTVYSIPKGLIVGTFFKGKKFTTEVGEAFGKVGKDIESIGRNATAMVPIAGPYLLDVYAAAIAKLTGEKLGARLGSAPSAPVPRIPLVVQAADQKSISVVPIDPYRMPIAVSGDILTRIGCDRTRLCEQLGRFANDDINVGLRIIKKLEAKIVELSKDEEDILIRAKAQFIYLAQNRVEIGRSLEEQLQFSLEVVKTLYLVQPMNERIFFPADMEADMICYSDRVRKLTQLIDSINSHGCTIDDFIEFYLVQIEDKINEAEGYTGPCDPSKVHKGTLDCARFAISQLNDSGIDLAKLAKHQLYGVCLERMGRYNSIQ